MMLPATKKLRRPKQKTLPAVLTIDEVHRLIGAVRQQRNAAYFWTVYSLGLRHLHLTDDGEDNGRAKLDEITQPGELFQNKFPQAPPAKPETDDAKGKGDADKRDAGKRAPGKRKPK